ncbi:hypothetical protein RHHCN13_07950 [Rickettsia conorii subsp. heilongjiangensis]|uniref:Uncharacterized protein n=1 Tax=Rickettsia conorii subsp. heilongjiangensis TaxID=226665 RepID=A0AAD1GJB2_RICCR|nr:hypothetical protein RHCH81_07950 [Rickettsia conorii subsp. heilongjiangensis]BBM92884.1 hypothetical protein RHHCN13_07950 [Rickettsia conorii subsp. heilongjiangensis]BBM94093.1 hypothetical protein RHSENDAI29_07950 [Rickettsia conorii subsp. heilongjiangensis]BBM95302.1 hypothetical protein RHSENDAI58_07950 [Rickettsia conorii subsp. heilongjiangensis]
MKCSAFEGLQRHYCPFFKFYLNIYVPYKSRTLYINYFLAVRFQIFSALLPSYQKLIPRIVKILLYELYSKNLVYKLINKKVTPNPLVTELSCFKP